MRSPALLVLAGLVLCSSTASAQFPPDRLKNVKVLPADLPVRALLDTMGTFTRALGVRCVYCHAGAEGTPFSQIDFASDSNPVKAKAREMLRMVTAINGEHLTKLADRREPAIVVTCATCHRGVAQPRPLQQVIISAYDAGGADSAEATYRGLRERYYGRAAYDFGEVALADVAGTLRRREKLPDALRMHKLNTEFSPKSAFAWRQAADAQLAARDTAQAITSLEHAVELNARDAQAKALLEKLRAKP